MRLTPNQQALLARCSSSRALRVRGATLRNARVLEGLGLVTVEERDDGANMAKRTAAGDERVRA